MGNILDHDGMNTRHEILKDQADGCYVSSNVWNDPFSSKQLTRASDHGGVSWSMKNKERFASDPLNLLAADDSLNQSKGARGPTKWLPPNHQFRCEYLNIWENVLSKYPTLKMTSKENRIFIRQIKACDS